MWSYNTNRDSEMHYFHSHEETVFAIMCVMRFSAVTNDVADYYIYKDGKYVDILEGDFLYNLYIENGGITLGVEGHDLQSAKNSGERLQKEHRGKKQVGGKCISVSEESIVVDNNTSYKKLVLETMGKKGVLLNAFVLEHGDIIVKEVLPLLTERERDIVIYLYGIYDEETCGKPRTEVASLFDVSVESIKRIEAKALRKLKHPLRNEILLGKKLVNSGCENYTEYSNKLKCVLVNEIEELIKMSDVELVYLKRIMERYNIEITNETVANCDLSDIGLSIRTFNCLRQVGINDLAGLIKTSDDELQKIRNIGRKCYEEVKEAKSKRFEINKSNYITIVIKFHGEKVIYKYADFDVKQIAKSILEEILHMELNKKSLFKMQLSSRLLEMLLIKGYLFFEDVIEDAMLLIEQFKKCELVDIADEIEKLFNDEKKKNMPVYLYPAKNSICKFINKNNCTSASDLICMARGIEDEDVQGLVQELIDNGFV